MVENINIIEPTLTSEAGHCFSFISSLVQVAGNTPLTVWCGRPAKISFPENVQVNHFFIRKVRRFQALWLYRKLLRFQERIFVSTADRTDILLLDWAARGRIAPRSVYLYVHWFRPSRSKRAQLAKLARHQPEIIILTPTTSVCEEFQSAGFNKTKLVPYPITPCETATCLEQKHEFRHLLFAGTARQDKGFSSVVDLVQLLGTRGTDLTVVLQTSADHYDKCDETTRNDIRRLESYRYPHLRRISQTLPQSSYQGLFAGAICLQLYSRSDFGDRISGVTLDALSAGSPVITLSETWMARAVSQYDAGLVIETAEPEKVYKAVMQVRDRYEHYRNNAVKAGRELQAQNSAEHLFQELAVK